MKKKQHHPEFDFEAATKARDKAIKQVDENAEPEWKTAARLVIRELAHSGNPFTTDDVWRELVKQENLEFPHEPRAMGAVMMGMAKAKVIIKLDDMRQSSMVGCHRRPKQLWIGV